MSVSGSLSLASTPSGELTLTPQGREQGLIARLALSPPPFSSSSNSLRVDGLGVEFSPARLELGRCLCPPLSQGEGEEGVKYAIEDCLLLAFILAGVIVPWPLSFTGGAGDVVYHESSRHSLCTETDSIEEFLAALGALIAFSRMRVVVMFPAVETGEVGGDGRAVHALDVSVDE